MLYILHSTRLTLTGMIAALNLLIASVFVICVSVATHQAQAFQHVWSPAPTRLSLPMARKCVNCQTTFKCQKTLKQHINKSSCFGAMTDAEYGLLSPVPSDQMKVWCNKCNHTVQKRSIFKHIHNHHPELEEESWNWAIKGDYNWLKHKTLLPDDTSKFNLAWSRKAMELEQDWALQYQLHEAEDSTTPFASAQPSVSTHTENDEDWAIAYQVEHAGADGTQCILCMKLKIPPHHLSLQSHMFQRMQSMMRIGPLHTKWSMHGVMALQCILHHQM